MIMYVWLDDIRPVPEICDKYPVRKDAFDMNNYITYAFKSVNIAKSYIQAAIENNRYDGYLFDLDHDLGDYANDGGDAIKLIDWLIENYHDKNMKFKFRFHSMNPVGVQNMRSAFEKYWEVA